jgi:energy-coupling factor transporter ATP-binding protein EcfA2
MQTDPVAQSDHESEFVACLLEAAHKTGLCFSEAAFVNFYVALKSKPMVILTGPEGSGKIKAVQCLSRILMGDCAQCQLMVGHPWAFSKSENLAMFTEVYARYTTEKLRWLIEEAWQPQNTHRVYIACLTRISPGELLSFFTEMAAQLRRGHLTRLGDIHFSGSIPFPPNLFLIGTMDTLDFDWWDPDLLSKTTVVQWPIAGNLSPASQNGSDQPWEGEFLRSLVRNKQTAYHKIHSILRRQKQPLLPLLRIEALLREHAILNLHELIDEAMLYLANSWSRLGNGLFDPSIPRNLEIALDLAMAQILLPHAGEKMREDEVLRVQLLSTLTRQFPRSTGFVAALANPQ